MRTPCATCGSADQRVDSPCAPCRKRARQREFYHRTKDDPTRKAVREGWRKRNPDLVRAATARGVRRHNAKLAAIVQEAKDAPCVGCGNEYPSVVMDLHHRDPATKEFNLGQRKHYRGVDGQSMEDSVRAEAAKCDPICANCHRLHHAGLLEL